MSTVKGQVAEIVPLGAEIKSFRFAAPAGQPFTGMAPVCHVDVHLPNGLIRQYSLWDWDPAGAWIAVGVKKEPAGRGGSAWLHDNLKTGDSVDLGGIRNNFVLDENAGGYTLIAGGIGVTPMVAMARRLKALGKPFHFYYLARDEKAAGFDPVLKGLGLDGALTAHRDDRDGLFDIKALLSKLPGDTQVYFCGPEGMLQAVLTATEGWPSSRVHFERFVAAAATDAPKGEFQVVLAKTDRTFEIPADKSILDVLLDAGLTPDFGCMGGVCGACTTSVIEGEVDHHDSVMPAEQHDAEGSICICVSRAKSARLVLDL